MFQLKVHAVAVALAGSAAILGSPGSAFAQDSTAQSLLTELQQSGAHLTYVRDSRRHRDLRGKPAGRYGAARGRRFGYADRGYYQQQGYGYGRGYGYRHRYGYRRGGAALGGLAAGALVGGALAAQAQDRGGDGQTRADVAYCTKRFKSYDPASGTYLGYDGKRHPCP